MSQYTCLTKLSGNPWQKRERAVAAFKKEDAYTQFKRVYVKFVKGLSDKSKIAAQVLAAIAADDFLTILELDIKPSNYDDGEMFANDYAIQAFVKKCQDLPIDVNRKLVALKGAADGEAQCKRTTLLWNQYRPLPEVYRILERTREIIKTMLGAEVGFIDIWDKVGYGPGSSSSCNGRDVSLTHKLTAEMDVTSDAFKYAYNLVDYLPQYDAGCADVLTLPLGPHLPRSKPKFKIIDHNKFTTVPKTALTDRGICIEPHMNILLQKAVGTLLRQKLQKFSAFGYNLRRQHETNRDLARIGSITGSIATVDLKMASDTISTVLVEYLLPEQWFRLLDDLRSKKTLYPCGTLHRNYKFSSMGNGFTFELESIIFFALTLASSIETNCPIDHFGKQIVYSFGDDIICHSTVIPTLLKVFSYCGFSVNSEKSFFDSTRFRESCGADFWDGGNIRPIFLKEVPKDETDFIKLANAIRRYANRRGCDVFCDIRLLPSWRCAIDIHKKLNNWLHIGPESLGDIVLHATPDEVAYRGNILRPFNYGQVKYCTAVKKKGIRARIVARAQITSMQMSREEIHFIQENVFLRIKKFGDCHLPRTLPYEVVTAPVYERGADERRQRHSFIVISDNDEQLRPWL